MGRLAACFLILILAFSLCFPVFAADTTQDITSTTQIAGSGYRSFDFLFDKNTYTYQTSTGNTSITLENAAGMGSLYLLFNLEYGSYTITDTVTGQQFVAGQYSFLHEFVDLISAFGYAPTSVTLDFAKGSVRLSEIYVFSGTDTPDFVQKWQPPLEGGADIVLFATHGDDDHLFFAGLLPLYAKAKGCRVQVVYMTDHRNLTTIRTHEMLNGLWSVGVSAYPVFGGFADFWIGNKETTYAEYENNYGTTQEMLQEFVVRQLRRFRPLVAVGHDINGEYANGMHMVYTDLLIKALPLIGDPNFFPESAERYGLWQLPKLYLHMYKENSILMDYDQPMDILDGLTPFQYTQKYGFPCHKSQHGTVFWEWLNGYHGEITKATQIKNYNPCKFGLYHSTVGEDVAKNDFLENIITYAEQERLEQERLEQERLEQERLEQERLEQERLEQERLEQERLEQERLEQERLEQERLAKEQLLAQQQKIRITAIVSVLFLAIAILLFILQRKQKII